MTLTKRDQCTAISLPCAKATRTALIIEDGATDAQLAEIGLSLASIEGSRSWWIGDYGVTLTSRKGEHYTAGRAEVLGIEDQSFRVYVGVSRFYNPLTRIYDLLTFSHYRAAQDECGGDLAVAQEWLQKAQDGGWSVSQLRKAMRRAGAELTNDSSEAEQNEFEFMDKADKWATTNRTQLAAIDKDTARNLLEVRWCGVVQFIDELRKIAK